MTEKNHLLCPFHWQPCIREQCMAWSKKQDLEELERDHKESFDALVEAIAMSECVSKSNARKIVEIRNNNERCKLIQSEQPI